MTQLILHSQDTFFNYVLEYIYNNYKYKINKIKYISEREYKSYEWERNRDKTKKIRPESMNIDIDFEGENIHCELYNIEGNNTQYLNQMKPDGCSGYEIILQELKLMNDNEDILLNTPMSENNARNNSN